MSRGSHVPVALRPRPPARRLPATWRQADPARIAAALDASQQRDAGGWYVAAPSREVGARASIVRDVAGREVVLWRDSAGVLRAGPGACPHLGARLDGCPVIGDAVRCKWHGLALTPRGSDDWRPWPAHDDGVLAWVRLPTPGERLAERPVLAARPPLSRSIAAVVEVRGHCEPQDVIANRLDPWHGSWLHPYAFSHLTVDESASRVDLLVVDVTFRLGRALGVPVRAEFCCPDSRTVVMSVVAGEGAGSVVETHATPRRPEPDGRPVTSVIEATIAHSTRKGFLVARGLSRLVEPAMRHTARRLWVDDLDYAERRYLLRMGTDHTS